MHRENLILKYIKNMKGKWAVCLLAVVGVMLLLLGGAGEREGKTVAAVDYFSSSESYKMEMVAEITELCTRVSGDPSPTVTLTLERGEEYVYAKRADGSYVTSSGGAVLLCAKAPKVCGVAVVCRNGSLPEVKSNLTSLICSLLGIGSNRVFVSDVK